MTVETSKVHELLGQDIERQAAIAHRAYEATLIPGNLMTSIVYHPEAKGDWHVDDSDPDYAYRIIVGTAPGWRHTTLLERVGSAKQPIAYLIHEDDDNIVIFQHGDITLETHSGVVEPYAFCHAGIPSNAIESCRDTGPETLAKIERAVELVYIGEVARWESQRLAAIRGGSLDGNL